MKIKNRKLFAQRLKNIPQQVRKQIARDLNLGADEMVQVAKSFAPKNNNVLVGTIRKERVKVGVSQRGAERLQIKVRAGGASTTKPVRKGSKATYDYALAQEFGTTKSPANPFFWPAYRLTKKRAKSRITRNSNKIIKRIFAK